MCPWKLQLTFMIWRPYDTSWSKRSLSRCGLLGHILCEWRLMRHYFEWMWIFLGGWGNILGWWWWVGHYFGWVGVGGNIFWVGWRGWGWVGVGVMFDNTIHLLRSRLWQIEFVICNHYANRRRISVLNDVNSIIPFA